MKSCLVKVLGSSVLKAVLLAMVILTWAASARGQVNGFTGDLATNNWVNYRDAGTIFFTNADTELFLIGPTNALFSNEASADTILYVGPNKAGLPSAGVLSFDWYFNSGDAQDGQGGIVFGQAVIVSKADGGSQQQSLGEGGPDTVAQGSVSLPLEEGDQLSFLLTTLNGSGPQTPGELIISNVRFDVPEPSVPALLGCGITLAALLRRNRSDRSTAGR